MNIKYLYSVLVIFAFLWANTAFAINYAFDAKYVKVGVVTNEWNHALADDPNIRNIGTLPNLGKSTTETQLNQMNAGKAILDMLLCRDSQGLHMDVLYSQALSNTILEEEEIASLDASAGKDEVLKREISRQLMKSNYILIFYKVKKKEIKYYWKAFKVLIDDEIIDQAFMNWRDPARYDQIRVPVKYVGSGRYKDLNKLIIKIAKKIPDFAVRGSIGSVHPTLARIDARQGMRNMDKVFIYGIYADKEGNLSSKKKGTTRATIVSQDNTRLLSVSGKNPSKKKGDIAVLRDRNRSSISVEGQASFGNDPRYGGRLQYELMLYFSKKGLANYFLLDLGYNQYNKEPFGYWYDGNLGTVAQPQWRNVEGLFGYGLGFNFLNKFELMPYVLGGIQFNIMGSPSYIAYWSYKSQNWSSWSDKENKPKLGIIGYGGLKLSINVYYPVQLIVGADYNYIFTPKEETANPIVDCHKTNRLNYYVGLRYHF